jgi:hypothetical protein
MAVTDLTGTTWVLNQNGVDVSTLYTWNVNYDVTGTFAGSYTVLAIVWNTHIPEEESTLSGSTSGLAPFAGESWSYEGTFTFTGGTDATSATLIAWLQDNAVQQVITRNDYFTCTDELTSIADAIRTKGGTSASLTYPSGFVTAINNLPTKVLGAGTISGYDSPFDIQVTADDYSAGEWDGFSSVSINISTPFYDGSCDIINPVRIIEFTAYDGNLGRTYSLEAEDGMTWSQWISSEYNSDGFSSQGTSVLYPGHESAVTTSNGGSVTTSSVIIDNHAYNYTLW